MEEKKTSERTIWVKVTTVEMRILQENTRRAEPLMAGVAAVQSLSHIGLFVTPWTAACQASLSITNSRSPLKLMSIESVMPSSHLILCRPLLLLPFSSCPQSFHASGSFPMSQLFTSGGQNIGASVSASVLPMNIQDCFALGLIRLILLVQRTLKSLLQHHSLKASILWLSAFFMV